MQVIPGKGRGLVATEDIAEGKLIFCSRAFAIEFHDPESDSETAEDFIKNDKGEKNISNLNEFKKSVRIKPCADNAVEITSLHDDRTCLLIQKIYDRIQQDPELGKNIYQLFAGNLIQY